LVKKIKKIHVAAVAALISVGVSAANPNFSKVTAEVDTNHDGNMSQQEWQSAGLPESSFNMFECGRGYVTQQDYEKNAAPDGIDMDGDGFLTVAEFKAFDKKMSANMPQGEAPAGPPPGPAPGGCDN